MSAQGMTYEEVGVNYNAMDPFKRACQLAGLETASNIGRIANGEFCEVEASRGESVYLIEAAGCYLAHVEEGLGTKNLVADAMYKLTDRTYYDGIAQDTVAMIVNDMITLGALPLSVAMHLAVGSSNWFLDEQRSQDLINGWKAACNMARCTWGGGETPTLRGVINPEAVVLSGSAVGIVNPKERLINPANIQRGDAIVLLNSSGIHANGLTLAREIATKLPNGYLTDIGNRTTYGEALLAPTVIYVPIVEDCMEAGVPIHYAINLTGHGWRKLMRAEAAFTYYIDQMPEPPVIFGFIQEHGPVDDKEAYGNLNMGVGFVLMLPYDSAEDVIRIASGHGIGAMIGGYVDRSSTYGNEDHPQKCVVLSPLGIEWTGEALGVR